MHPKRKRKLIFIVAIGLSLDLALSLALYALKQNINLFYTPSQLMTQSIPSNRLIRLGGTVQNGSYFHLNHSVATRFIITDHKNRVKVRFSGVLPDLFREGQSVVVAGTMNRQHIFSATQVLAKHNATYIPRAIKSI